MSIVDFSNKINRFLSKDVIPLERVDIIAKSGRKRFKFENYTTEKLEEFVKENDKVKVHPYYWNYKFCTLSNLDNNVNFNELTTPDNIILNTDLYFDGSIIMILTFMNILWITYCLKDEKEYIKFLNDSLNIDKELFVDFLINNNYNLPLTRNYYNLIKRIFRKGNNILKLLLPYNKKPYYDVNEILSILENIDYGSIHDVSYYLSKTRLDNCSKLRIINNLLENYDDVIDAKKNIYYSIKKRKRSLSFDLYSMDIEKDLVDYYFDIWDKIKLLGGSIKVIITDDDELNNKFLQRYEMIKN